MTLFGQTLDGQQIFSLISMLAVLVLWIAAWRNDRRETAWLKKWNADRKARREAEQAAESNERGASTERRDRRGPWG